MILLAALVAVALPMSVASATSLGIFDDVVLSGAAQDALDCVPSVSSIDATETILTVVTALPLTVLPVSVINPLATTDLLTVDVTGIDADCVGMTPVLFVIGEDAVALSPDTEILGRFDLAPLTVTTASQTLSVGSELTVAVLSEITELRIVMQPSGL